MVFAPDGDVRDIYNAPDDITVLVRGNHVQY